MTAALALMTLTACPWDSPKPKPPPLLMLDEAASYAFAGWGTSLAWWANIIGTPKEPAELVGPAGRQWHPWPGAQREFVLDALFGDPATALTTAGPAMPAGTPTPTRPAEFPLGLNVLRYNIGGSPPDDQTQLGVCQNFRPGGRIPTPQRNPGAPIDLGADARQVDVLRTARHLIDSTNAPGETTVLEAFVNSPPWWMTKANCSAGSPEENALDLSGTATDAARSYADYLVQVLDAFRRQEGIDFATVAPFNEPSPLKNGDPTTYWNGCPPDNPPDKGCQEGANVTPDGQRKVVAALCQSLRANDPHNATQVKVSISDGNTVDETLRSAQKLEVGSRPQPGSSNCVGQLNTHGYSGLQSYDGGARADLRRAAGPLPLWVSEFGAGNKDAHGSCDQRCSALHLSKQIADDLQDLRPSAWVYWQALEGGTDWGLLQAATFPNAAESGRPTLSTRYWALSQYSRYIRGGSRIYPLRTGAKAPGPDDEKVRVVVAKNPRSGQVTVVATNSTHDPQSLAVSLGSLAGGGTMTVHRLTVEDGRPTSATPAKMDLRGSVLEDSLLPGTITSYVLGEAAPSAATMVQTFQPWQPDSRGFDQPAPGLVVTKSSGTCDSGTNDDPGRADAFRCAGPGNVCFPPHSSGDPGSPVLCSGDPTSNQVVLLDQSGGHLPLDRANAEDLAAPPWFLVLADGKKCRFIGYGTNTADALRYECGDNVGATEPDRSNTRWTVREGLQSSPASLGPPVAVLTAHR